MTEEAVLVDRRMLVQLLRVAACARELVRKSERAREFSIKSKVEYFDAAEELRRELDILEGKK